MAMAYLAMFLALDERLARAERVLPSIPAIIVAKASITRARIARSGEDFTG